MSGDGYMIYTDSYLGVNWSTVHVVKITVQ